MDGPPVAGEPFREARVIRAAAVLGRTLRRPIGGAAGFLLLVLIVYADPLFLSRNFAGRDLTAYNLPVEQAIHDAYRRGRLPVWLDGVSGGRPLLPNPNIGALYPARPLLSLLPFPIAAKLFPLLHWALAGAGVLLFLRGIGLSGSGAWVGAVTYVFSGVSVSEVFFPHLPGLAILPWILWALTRRGASPTGRIVVLSLLLALDLAAGDVFTVGLALLAGVLWIVREGDPAQRMRDLGRLGAALLLSALAAAPQLVATALWIPETNRSVLGMRLGEVFYFSLPPARLLELAIPFPFGDTWAIDPSRVWSSSALGGKAVGMFATLYAGAFGAIAIVETWRRRGPGLRFARSLALLTVVLSVVPSLMPAAWGRFPSPLSLRNPEKLAIGLTLAVGLLAAHAFDALRGDRGARTRWAIAAGALIAAAALVASLRQEHRAGAGASGALAEGGLYWMATVLALAGLRRAGDRTPAVPLLLLTAVPIAANRRIAQTFRADEIFPPTRFARFVQRQDPAGDYRTLGESHYFPPSALQNARHGADRGYLQFSRRNWEQYTHVFWRRGTVLNYDFDAGDLSRVESLRRLARTAARYSDASAFFGALSLKFGVRFRDQPPLPGFTPVGGDALQAWDEHAQAFPDIRLLTSWREAGGPLAAVQALPRLAPGEVVLETGRDGSGTAAPGTLRALEKTPERIVLETRTTAPGWLFVLRGHWRHRAVRVDGERVADVPAQIGFSALPLPAGAHRVEWREEVPGGRMSRWGPVLYLLGVAWIVQKRGAAAARRPA